MIIKSMTRKEPIFDSLLAYLHRGRIDERFQFYHNLYSRKAEDIQREFVENARHLRKRQNGVHLYHEILSIKKCARLSEFRQKEILQEIARQYVMSRSGRSLVYGVLHDEHVEHLHYHLMISANEAGSAERIRMSKAEFAQVKTQLEVMVQQRYPELEQGIVMGRPAKGEKLSQAGVELKRRTGKTPERDDLKARLHRVFQASDKAAFFRLLETERIRVYVRGQSIGFEDLKTGRKHRLKTLGLEAAFEAVNARLERVAVQETETAVQDTHPASGLSEEAIRQAQEQLALEAREQAAREALRAAQAERARVEALHAEERRKRRERAGTEAEAGAGQAQQQTQRQNRTPGEAPAGEDAAADRDAVATATPAERLQAAIEARQREMEALRSRQRSGSVSEHIRKR